MFTVTISEKGGQQQEYDFSKPEITIGRMKGNDIVLPKGNVSKQHTRIFMRDDNFFIVDLKSTNGTYVNGRKVTAEQSIGESDKIYIGDFILQLKHQSAQPSAGPPRPPSPPENAPMGSDGGGPGGGPASGGRQFPTVMEGARSGGLSPQQKQAQPQGSSHPTSKAPPVQSHGPSGPQRSSSGAGSSMGSDSPASSGGLDLASGPSSPESRGSEDLRKTYGDSSPPVDLGSSLQPVQEEDPGPEASISSSGSIPSPSPPGGSPSSPRSPGPGGAPPSPQPSSPGGAPTPSPSLTGGGGGLSTSTPTPAPGSESSGGFDRPGSDALSGPGGPTAPETPEDTSIPGGAQPLGASALVSDTPLESEFDEQFHLAQQDAVRVFFESFPAVELPLDYPLNDAGVQNRIEAQAKNAITTVGASVDDQALLDVITKEATGLGPLEDYLDDEKVQSIFVNAYDRIVLRRDGELVIAKRAYSHPEMLDIAARRLLGPHDTPPVSDEVRFGDGTRVHILMPPVAVDGPVLTVQKPNHFYPSLDELQEQQTLSAGMSTFLKRVVESGRSVLIAGPISSGKSTLLAALADTVPSASRVVAVEQHSNLPGDSPNFIRLEASPGAGMDMSFLVQNAVAMHPERIIVDECRGAEAYDWVTTATSGTQGSMITLNATSAVDALSRLESMCLLGASDVSPRGLREQIARAVDLVVVVNNTAARGFRVQQIVEVQGVDLDAFRLNDIFYYRVEGTAGDFHPTGYIPLFYEDLRHAGFDVDLSIFRE